MARIESVIQTVIVRLAKREMRAAFPPLKREVRQMRIKLFGLSKGITAMTRSEKKEIPGAAENPCRREKEIA